ncbi:MAG TPA: alkaline phosphatase family protein [Thermoleophilaceae bacterium]|nr:alkaline phosphatase family protein [Thermoleophilaceae bacterium]
MKKLVLAVVDSLKPEMLDRAIAEGRAPALGELVRRGAYVRDCVSTFPSVTPVASATITTGLGPDEHLIPSMNWYHRGDERYVEYGSSFQATRAFGVVRSLYDTVYNMNLAHLSQAHRTLFERLEDAGLRTACTTFLIYRGRTRHEPEADGVYTRVARAAQFRHATWGPTELFYADLFASRRTDCRSTLGMPGQRDQHTGCVGAHMVENDLADFMLCSLPDNDSYSHRRGPFAQVTSIAVADRAIERIMHVAGGPERFLEDHAVIVASDHSQTAVERSLDLVGALRAEWRVLAPEDPAPEDAELAVSPSARYGMVYVLDPDRRERTVPRVVRRLQEVDGVDLIIRRVDGQAAVWSRRGELRFAPGGELADGRGGTWSVEGERAALDLRVQDGVVSSEAYPLALERVWSAVSCPGMGDVLVSAEPGCELVDWGGAAHVGGGSHGSLHRGDSLGALIMCGVDPSPPGPPHQWTLADIAPLVSAHFAVPS